MVHLIAGNSMRKGASPFGKDIVEKELTTMFDSKWLRAKAIETRLVERERKIDPVIMFWALAIGYGTQLYRTLTELKREYEVRGKVSFLSRDEQRISFS